MDNYPMFVDCQNNFENVHNTQSRYRFMAISTKAQTTFFIEKYLK